MDMPVLADQQGHEERWMRGMNDEKDSENSVLSTWLVGDEICSI